MMLAISRLSVLTLLLSSTTCFADAITTQAPQIAIGHNNANSQAVSQYQKLFRSWHMYDWGCTPCQEISPGVYCPCGAVENRTLHWPPQSFSGSLHTQTTFNPSASLASATGTLTRTVLVRVPTGEAPKSAVSAHMSHSVDDAAGTHAPNTPQKDVTSEFYKREISGHDPHTIPITIDHPVTAGSDETRPVVLLGHVNTTLLSSFISLPLVNDLNLSKTIRPFDKPPAYAVERDLTRLFGYDTYPMGLVDLHVLAGKNDKAREVQFTVIHAPEDHTGRWHPDVVLGMHLLNALDAIQLTAEYTGSEDAGAKEGLEILVQRVIQVGNVKVETADHDEL